MYSSVINAQDSGILHSDGLCLSAVHRILGAFINNIKDDSPSSFPTVLQKYIQPYLGETQTGQESRKDGDKLYGDHSLVMGVQLEWYALI